jgi:LCP family protein required for cell wall assembly
MLKHLARLALILLLVSLACSVPTVAQTPSATPLAVSQLLVSAGPDATATPTPFQPLGPTSTPRATATALPTETAEPDAEPTLEPTPVTVVQDPPEGTVSLLIMGSDFRPNSGFRTDVIMLVNINARLGKVSVVSFPRDLYVTIPGWMTQRINTAFPHGGFSMAADTFETNFGVRPQYYIVTNFQGFVGIVNSLGGVNVNVGQYLSDKCDLPQAVNTYCTVNPGVVTMDGDTALWYVRSRYSSSDFDRLRRAQEVIYAIFAKLMSLDAVSRLPELYENYRSSVETNLSVEDMVPLLPVASQVLNDSSRIQRYSIGPGQVYPYWTPDGAAVLLPDYGAISLILQEALFNP